MKGRLNSALGALIAANVVGLFLVLFFAYTAGSHSGGLSLVDGLSAQSNTPVLIVFAALLVVVLLVVDWIVLSSRVLKPVKGLVEFSDKLAAGEYTARPSIDATDDFGLIAANLNRSSQRIVLTVNNQEAQETLQRSVTDFLTIVSQIARGDLTLRGKVTNDALGNVVDSVNYMLDNFAKVLERVRKAAIDVSSSANEILLSSEEMSSGAIQQDQEITNTSSAV
ncbi:MAG TPA: methyl-accepting chemotaxis protein, partial [Terriglobales bacterium]